MKKFILLIIFSCTCFYSVFSQNNFDHELGVIAKKLDEKIVGSSQRFVKVASFTDLQGNTTEFGRYLADALSIELTSTTLSVIDRSGNEESDEERLLMKEHGIKKDSLKVYAKKMGFNYLVMGTTTLLDNDIIVAIKVLDIQKGVLITGVRSQLPRTEAINNLLKSTIRNNGESPANLNVAQKIDTHDKSSVDDLFGARISDLRKGECSNRVGNDLFWYGQVCFENQTGEDIMFYCTEANPEGWLSDYKVVIPDGARNCSRLIAVNCDQRGVNENENRQASFRFYSTDGRRRAIQPFIIDKCIVKSYILTKRNLVLMKD